MALWAKVQQLNSEFLRQVQQVYGENFPIDVRCALAQWIEERPWNELDPDNPQHDNFAGNIVANLIQEIETKVATDPTAENFLLRLKLSEAANYFKQKYVANPQHLVRIIKHCLQTEMRIVHQAENICQGLIPQISVVADPVQEINLQVDKLRHKTQETDEELRRMHQEQETFVIQYQESSKCQARIQQVSSQSNGQSNVEVLTRLQREKEMYDQSLRQKVAALGQQRLLLTDKYQDTVMDLNDLQKRVLDSELIQWKRGQQLVGNGVTFENNLDQIQEWCEALAEIIWQNRQQIKRLEMLCTQLPLGSPIEKLTTLNQQITGLLSSLVTSTFIIEKQPPQVMKTNTRFSATVRLLVGGKLNVHMTPPQVKVTIISENQAISLLKNDKGGTGEASGDILNNMGTMEYHQSTRQLSVSFRNMQLRKIKRAEKKGTESVMDEKFSLLFQSQFKVGGGELVFQVWTLSLPVVVIVHGNQEPHAWATVTWDNAFAEPGRVPFQVPEKVKWADMADVLSTKFKASTGRELLEDNLHFLAGKAFRNTQIQDYSNMMLSWSQFCKEPLPERNFTFWEWFYAIMKITREHLRGPWIDGLVLGFVGRRQAEEMLFKRSKGTFLLRFSDSELGGVTIAWVDENQQQVEVQDVYMIQPFTSRDFGIRSLADRISDLKNLHFLYPDIPKDQAFGKYYTPLAECQPPSINGYVRPMLVTQIPGLTKEGKEIWAGVNPMESYPSTPQSVMHPQSPDPCFHDISSTGDQPMHAGVRVPELDYDLINMDLVAEMDDAVDFSSINVNDLVAYTKPN